MGKTKGGGANNQIKKWWNILKWARLRGNEQARTRHSEMYQNEQGEGGIKKPGQGIVETILKWARLRGNEQTSTRNSEKY